MDAAAARSRSSTTNGGHVSMGPIPLKTESLTECDEPSLILATPGCCACDEIGALFAGVFCGVLVEVDVSARGL